VLRTPELDSALAANPRPVLLQRLADLAAALRNEPLAQQLDAAARRITTRTNSPSRTGIGTRITVPHALQQAPRAGGSPWMDAQRMRLTRQETEVRKLIGQNAAKLTPFPWRTLRAHAQQAKAHDAYHSTTMEGYRISPEVAEAIVRGEPYPDGPHDAKALEAAMAVKGYSMAFSLVLERARKKAPVDADLILDLHEALFRPSVDVGITEPAALRGWRNSSVSLRGWRHVPPNPKKVADLISGLESFAARDDLAPIARALLVHLEFVTIHPFLDGNGRLGRLLMNHALLSAGLPWTTVRNDERIPFFRSIETAQVADDIEPFVRFMWHLIKEAVRELDGNRTRRAGSRTRK
jgi:Fic family protein